MKKTELKKTGPTKTDPTKTGSAKNDLKKNDLKKNELKKKALKQQVSDAIHACQEKKAEQIAVLELEQGSGAFTDYFVVCSGSNPRQIQAISDEVELRLKRAGQYPNSIEGYKQAEWVLIDYVDFVVHIFSEAARRFYDLERLWKSAKKVEPAESVAAPRKKAVAKKAVRKRA